MADFAPPFVVTEEEIRTRVFEVIRALFPNYTTDPATREGDLLWALTAPFIKEVQRFYSDLNEAIKVSFLQYTTGEYLDSKGLEVGLDRKPAAASSGTVRFFGNDQVLIPTGTSVSTASDEEGNFLSFQVDSVDDDGFPIPVEDRIINAIEDPIVAPTIVAGPNPSNIYGSVLYKYSYVTALAEEEAFFGETVGSEQSSPALLVNGTDVEISIPAVPVYTGLQEIRGVNVYRSLNSGSGWSNFLLVGTVIGDLTSGPIDFTDDIGNVDFGVIRSLIKTVNTTGIVDLKATATEESAASNILNDKIIFLDDTVPGVTKVTNPDVFSGGADVESDDNYRERLLEEIRKPPGAGNVADYVGWAKQVVGVESATVIPEWEIQFTYPNGPGTVKVIISGIGNTIVNNDLVEDVRQFIAGDIAVDSPWQFTGGNSKPTLTVVNPLGGDMDNGEYQYVYTYVNVGGGQTPHNAVDLDGNYNGSQVLDVSVTSGTGTARVVLDGITTGPQGTSVENTIKRRIYRRNKADVDPKFYLVGEILGNVVTEFTDTLNDDDVALRFAPIVNSTSLYNGQAPIGAHITVESISELTIRVEGIIIPMPGYNLNGTGGNINLGDLIDSSLGTFFASLPAGSTIYYTDVQNAIHDTPGVLDFRNITIFTPEFPFGTQDNIEVDDDTIKPIYDPSGILLEAPE